MNLKSVLWFLAQCVFVPLAFVFVGPWKATRYLYRRVFDSWRSWAHVPLGLTTGLAGGIATTLFVWHGGALGFSFFGWEKFFLTAHHSVAFWYGLVGFLVTAGYLYPISWLVVLQWVWKVWKSYERKVGNIFDRNDGQERHGVALIRKLTKVFRVLPGSQAIWDKLTSATTPDGGRNNATFVELQMIATWAGFLWFAGRFAFSFYGVVHGMLAASLLSAFFSFYVFAFALFVFGLVVLPLFKILSTGKTYAIGVLAGVVVGYFTFAWFAAASPIVHYGATVAAGWLTIAYVYPYVTELFSGELIRRAIEWLKPLWHDTYNDRNNPYIHLFDQTTNLVGTAVALWFTVKLSVMLGLPVVGAIALLPAVAFAVYSVLGKVLDWSDGTTIIGALLSLAAGVATIVKIGFANVVVTIAVGIPAGLIAGLVMYFLLVPLAYQAGKKVMLSQALVGLTTSLGEWLHSAHQRAWARFDDLATRCSRVYWRAYGDDMQGLRQLFNHLVNIAVALAIGSAAHYMAVAGGHGALYVNVATALGAWASYLLGHKLVFRTRLEPVGFIFALIAALAVGTAVVDAQPLGLWFALPFGGFIGLLTFTLGVPGLYLLVKQAFTPASAASWSGAFDSAWQFVWNYTGFVFRFIPRLFNFLLPYFGWAMMLLAAAWALLERIWASVFGRRA